MAKKARKKPAGRAATVDTLVANRSVEAAAGKAAPQPSAAGSRPVPRYRRLSITGRQKHVRPEAIKRLPSAFQIFKKSLRLLWSDRPLFLGILAVYVLLLIVFAGGVAGGADLQGLKQAIGDPGGFGQLAAGLALFSVLLSSLGSAPTQAAGVYQSFMLLIVSLAVIWALRQVMAGEKVRVRDAFYQGMYPLVPVLLVLFVIGLQLLPMLIGAVLYALVVSNGIAVTAFEQLLWSLQFFLLSLLSLYLISGSVVALYIAALPNMPPVRALKSARELARWKRWSLMRKLLFLPAVLFILLAVIMLPVVLWLTPLAPWLFFLLSTLAIAVMHSYLYTVYRELLP